MPSRKLAEPSSHERDRRQQPIVQRRFSGVYQDPDPVTVPPDSLAKAINCHAMGDYVQPRNGSVLWSIPWPNEHEGITAHKEGAEVISDSGNIFTEDDVGNEFVWPNGLIDELTIFHSAQRMGCRDTDGNSGEGCAIRGKLNLWEWHSGRRVFLVQLGRDLYIGEPDFNTKGVAFTQVLIFSYDRPSNSEQDFIEDGDDAIINGSGGMFRVMFDNPALAYRMNSPIMNIRPKSTSGGERLSRYRYLCAAATLSGHENFRNRESSGVRLLTETGTNAVDENRRDWAQVKVDGPIHDGIQTYGVLEGGVLAAANRDAATWEAVTDGCVRVNINYLGWNNVLVDFSGVGAMSEVAERLQSAIRTIYPSAEVEYISAEDVPRIRITSGRIPGGTILHCRNGAYGTNIAAMLACRETDGARVTNPPVGSPSVLRELYVPVVPNTDPQEYQWHHTHFPIYRTADIGPEGLEDNDRKGSILYSHLNEIGKRVVNSADLFIWCKDLRVCGSFYARRHQGYIEVRFGELEQADVGSVMEFDDGDRVTITEWVNETLVAYDGGPYYNEASGWQAACIGNGRVARVSQSGDIVTRTHGTLFYDFDVRKPIQWPDGDRSYIREVLGPNRFRVWNSATRETTGITLDPQWRNFNDTIPDEELFTRVNAWVCKNRFMEPLKLGNRVITQPGFVLTAAYGQKYVPYSILESGYRQFLGYHVPAYQEFELEDRIVALVAFKNRYAVLCQGSWYAGVTNNAGQYTIEGTKQIVPFLSKPQKKGNIGCADKGSLRFVRDDAVRFITNAGEMAEIQSGETLYTDLAVDVQSGLGMFSKVLQKAKKKFAAIATRFNGYIFWYREQ